MSVTLRLAGSICLVLTAGDLPCFLGSKPAPVNAILFTFFSRLSDSTMFSDSFNAFELTVSFCVL